MKNIYFFLTMAVLALTLVTNSFAVNTNQSMLAEAAASAKQIVATNINDVMIEMLTGVKNASGEIYRFSQQEVGQSYDFLKSQAPEVMKEFLMWQVARSCVRIGTWGLIICLLFFLARQLKLRALKEGEFPNKDDCNVIKWILRIIACLILIFTLGVNGMTITKCLVAPRVYVIEYVVDLCKGKNTTSYR